MFGATSKWACPPQVPFSVQIKHCDILHPQNYSFLNSSFKERLFKKSIDVFFKNRESLYPTDSHSSRLPICPLCVRVCTYKYALGAGILM